jgi:uncharacterized delta-60 repeat protein
VGLSLRGAATAAGLLVLAARAAPGDLDLGFGTAGRVVTDFGPGSNSAAAVAIQADGKIVVVGGSGSGDFALARYGTDGALDATFGTAGKVTTDFGPGASGASAVAIQPDGKIVAAGSTAPLGFCCQFALARYDEDGNLDTSFGSGGMVTTAFSGNSGASAVVIQADGKIVAAGHTFDPFVSAFAIARYDADGNLDTSFGSGGRVTTDLGGSDGAADLAILGDGRILAVGGGGPGNDFALVLYTTGGSPDPSFGTAGKVTTDFGGFDAAAGVAIQADGKIVLAGRGSERFALARYDTNGGLDPSFGDDGKVATQFTGDNIESANAIAIQANGKIVAAGPRSRDSPSSSRSPDTRPTAAPH